MHGRIVAPEALYGKKHQWGYNNTDQGRPFLGRDLVLAGVAGPGVWFRKDTRILAQQLTATKRGGLYRIAVTEQRGHANFTNTRILGPADVVGLVDPSYDALAEYEAG